MVREFSDLLKKSSSPKGRILSASAFPTSPSSDFHGDKGLVGGTLRDGEWRDVVRDLYNSVPDIRFAAEFVGAAVSQAKLVVVDRNGALVSETAPLVQLDELSKSLQGDGWCDLTSSLRILAINWFLFGEAWITADPLHEGKLMVVPYDCVSTNSVTRRKMVQIGTESHELSQGDTCIRVFKPDPLNPSAATSHVRASLKIATTLNLLLTLMQSSGRSAIHNNILKVPNELEVKDDLVDQIYSALSVPLDVATSPDALVPTMVSGGFEALQHLEFISADRSFDESIPELVGLLRKWLAEGMDIPTEVIHDSSRDRTNHFSSYLTDKEFQNSHVRPKMKALCSALTSKLYRPSLIKGGMPAEQAEGYCLSWDDFALFEPTNKVQYISDFMKLGVRFTPELIAKHIGVDPSDIDEIVSLGPSGGVIDTSPTDDEQRIEDNG